MSPHTKKLSFVDISLKTFPQHTIKFLLLLCRPAYLYSVYRDYVQDAFTNSHSQYHNPLTNTLHLNHFSIHFSATKIPTPASPSSHPAHKNLYIAPSLPSDFALPPFHLVSCKQ